MLSFLNSLGKKSLSLPAKQENSESNGSGLSRTRTRGASDHTVTIQSFTPSTSNTDVGSLCTEEEIGLKTQERASERLRGSQPSFGSYNESVLSGTARKAARRKGVTADSRDVSGETLVDERSDVHTQSLHRDLQLFSPDWALDALPGEALRKSLEEEKRTLRRKSARISMIERATGVVRSTGSILGKRGRETIGAGIEKMQAIVGERKDKAISEQLENEYVDAPLKKRTKTSNETGLRIPSPTKSERRLARQPIVKHWLGQGLYVGQDRDFDPRLTETKNKLKRLSKQQPDAHGRRFFPLPMFAGQRTLELGRNFKLPFDIFSPLPPGQPRPEEWKKTHKNIFIGDAASVWKKSKRLESSRCVCTHESGCDEDCFNRFMFYECDSSNCNIGADHCTNRSFESLQQRTRAGGKYNVGVEVIKTLDRGHGVRSNRSFEPNQIIVEYTGEIITQDECDDRMRKRYKDSECYYLMDFDQHMILDATRGSIARFINHSCEPNCKMIKWTVAGKPRMALFAGEKGIMTGDELTYDYNFNPYSIKNVQECRCGALSCRGVLGPKPKEIKDALKPLTVGGKRKFQQALEDTLQKITKKRKLPGASSVTKALAVTKTRTGRKIARARILNSSTVRNKHIVKKAPTRLVKANRIERKILHTMHRVKRDSMITYSRRRSSAETFVKGSASTDEGPPSKRGNIKSKAASMRNGVVRTLRSSNRSGASGSGGKTIRVIDDGT